MLPVNAFRCWSWSSSYWSQLRPLHVLVSCKNSCCWEWTSEQAMPWVKQACVTRDPRDLVLWSCPGIVEWCCTGLTASYAIRLAWVPELVPLRGSVTEVPHAHLPCCRSAVLLEQGTGSCESELCAGRRKCLICSLATLPSFAPSVNWWRQVPLTVLCWEPTCLSCLLWALVETCWLSRTKLKLLMPHPVSLFHLAVMP